MTAQEYYTKINDLFCEWKSKHDEESTESYFVYGLEEVSKSSFSYDGVICSEKFFSQEVKILFVSKESNIGDSKTSDGSLSAEKNFWLQDVYNGKKDETIFSKRLSMLANAIINNNFHVTNKDSASLGEVSFLNLNKRGGTSKCEWKTINGYTREYSEYILDEIDLIGPTIIICCGKGLKSCLKKNVFKGEQPKCKIIEVFHPSYYFKKDEQHLQKLKDELSKINI